MTKKTSRKTKHGGAREGAGRPVEPDAMAHEEVGLGVRLRRQERDAVNAACEFYGVTVSDAVRALPALLKTADESLR